MTKNDYDIRYSAEVAVLLAELMCRALEDQDEELAITVEEIGYNLGLLKTFKNGVELPFQTDSMTEALFSDYIYEAKSGAKKASDFMMYIPGCANGGPGVDKKGMPDVVLLEHEINKLRGIVSEKVAKETKEHNDKITAVMKRDNSKWREKNTKS